MRISVIITVYNLEKFIRESMDSVFGQTRQPDEVIVVNDGSSDRSHDIITTLGKHIKYIRKEKNEGVLPAVISAIKESTGDILMFLDGDDIWETTKIDKVQDIFSAYSDVMLVTHNYVWIDKQSRRLNTVDATHRNLHRIGPSGRTNYRDKSERLKESVLTYGGVWLGSAFSIRRDALNINQFVNFISEYNKDYMSLSHQDQPLVAYLIATNPDKHLYYLDETLFYYRVFGENSSGNTTNREAALHTIKRSNATVAFTSHIVSTLMPERSKAVVIQRAHLAYFSYLENLYDRKLNKAMRHLIKSLPALTTRMKIKEAARTLIITVIGPKNYFRLK